MDARLTRLNKMSPNNPPDSASTPGHNEVFDHAELFGSARSMLCQEFQQWLLARLCACFRAEHGAMNCSHSNGYLMAEVVGFDIARITQDYMAAGPQHDSFTPRMRAHPDQAVCDNTYATGPWPPEAGSWQEMLLRNDLEHQLGIATTLPDDGYQVDLYLTRGRKDAPFSDDEIALLTAILPLLREALSVNQACVLARMEQPDLGTAFAITDPTGWIQVASQEFSRALADLSPLAETFSAPILPVEWLNNTSLANRSLSQYGWVLRTDPGTDGFKVWLLPQSESAPWHKLTERQNEIARLYAFGHSAKEIAAQLIVAENTVRVHIKHIYSRLDISTRQQLRNLFQLDSEYGVPTAQDPGFR